MATTTVSSAQIPLWPVQIANFLNKRCYGQPLADQIAVLERVECLVKPNMVRWLAQQPVKVEMQKWVGISGSTVCNVAIVMLMISALNLQNSRTADPTHCVPPENAMVKLISSATQILTLPLAFGMYKVSTYYNNLAYRALKQQQECASVVQFLTALRQLIEQGKSSITVESETKWKEAFERFVNSWIDTELSCLLERSCHTKEAEPSVSTIANALCEEALETLRILLTETPPSTNPSTP